MRCRGSFLRLPACGVIDRKHKHTEKQDNSRDDRENSAWPVTRFGRASCGFNLSLIYNLEQCFVEVAMFVRVRIEEKTLGTTFHGGWDLQDRRLRV